MAGRIALDLKQFKHVSSDAKSTTLQHKDGHSLVIAHGPLSGEARDQLKALAAMSNDSKKAIDKGEAKQDAERTQHLAKGGKVEDKADYKDQHTAPDSEDNSPLHDLTENGTFPKDIYSTPAKAAHLYGHGDKKMDHESISAIHGAKGKPDATVKMYRAVPKHVKEINHNDWVSLSPQYAENHGEARLGAGNYKVLSKEVPAKHLYNRGDIHEFGYSPPKDEGKQKLADGGPVKQTQATIDSDSTAKGIEQAKILHIEDQAPHGATIVIHPKQQKHGKVVQKFADGGEADVPAALAPSAPEETEVKATPQVVPEDIATPVKPMPKDANKPAIDPELARKREIYNQQILSNPAYAEDATGGTGADQDLFGKDGKGPANFDSTTWAQAQQQEIAERSRTAAASAEQQQKVIADNEVRASAGLEPLPVPDVPVGPQIPGANGQKPQQQANQLPTQVTDKVDAGNRNPGMGFSSDPETMLHQGYASQMLGIGKQASAQADLGQAQNAILQKQVQAQDTAKATYQKQYDSLEQERQAHMQDIKNGHIDPNKYWTGDKDGNGSHSKIAAGIGMILAGFNPTASPNAAVNFLKYQMDQNLDAQKKNLDSDQNLLSANLRQFGNLKDATDMTRLMQNDIVHNQLLQAAAKAATPMAQAAAMQAAGKLAADNAPLFQQFAMRRAMVSLANGSGGDPSDTSAQEQMIAYARLTNPEMAKEMENRLIPGVGMSKVPVPQDVRAEMIGKQTFGKMAQKYVDFVKKNANSVNPATVNAGSAMAAELQGAYRQAVKGGVFKEGEQQFIEKLIPSDPTQFGSAMRTLPKLTTLIQSNDGQLNTLKQGYGLPTGQSQAPQLEPVRGKDGNMYQKVTGGYQLIKSPTKR